MVRDSRRASLRMLTRMNTLSNGVTLQQHGTSSSQVCCVSLPVYILILPAGDDRDARNNVNIASATHCR
jgi:hypothetical protein